MATRTQRQQNFAANVRRLMRSRNLRQCDLARTMGVTDGYISQLLNGHSSPGLDAIERFAAALGVGPFELLEKNSASVANSA